MCLNGRFNHRGHGGSENAKPKRPCRPLKRALKIICLRDLSAKARIIEKRLVRCAAPSGRWTLFLTDPGVSLAALAYPWLPSSTPSACKAAHCQLHTANCSLPAAHCQLHTAPCLLFYHIPT